MLNVAKKGTDNSTSNIDVTINRRKRSYAASIWKHGPLVVYSAITVLPFLWTLSTSLKLSSEILSWPPTVIPQDLTFQNYIDVLSRSNFQRYILNSVVVTILTVLVTVLIALFAGYGTARYKFRGKDFLMFLILAGMAVGRFANVVPLYFMSIRFGLLNTYAILVLAYSAFITPLAVWLMRSYFKSVPPQLEEAAKIDGCNTWSAFWRVVVPVMQPPIVAASVIAMVHAWNEFILNLVLTSETSMRTVPVGLYFFLTYYGVNWGALTAAAIISILPILAMFLWLQRYFLQGLTSGVLGGS